MPSSGEHSPRALLILAAGAEEMEVTITVDILRRAGIDVLVAGLDGAEPVRCSRGITIVPDCALANATGPFDAIVLPGGAAGTDRLIASSDVGELLRAQERRGGLVAAICAAPAALVHHGVFTGRAMTSHPSVQPAVAAHRVYTSEAVSEDANLITSRGPGTAFAFALRLVTRLSGPEAAARIAPPMLLPDDLA